MTEANTGSQNTIDTIRVSEMMRVKYELGMWGRGDVREWGGGDAGMSGRRDFRSPLPDGSTTPCVRLFSLIFRSASIILYERPLMIKCIASPSVKRWATGLIKRANRPTKKMGLALIDNSLLSMKCAMDLWPHKSK